MGTTSTTAPITTSTTTKATTTGTTTAASTTTTKSSQNCVLSACGCDLKGQGWCNDSNSWLSTPWCHATTSNCGRCGGCGVRQIEDYFKDTKMFRHTLF